MPQNKQSSVEQPIQNEQKGQGGPHNPNTPKPESSSEYEGAKTRKPTGNKGVEIKTETSSSSGQ